MERDTKNKKKGEEGKPIDWRGSSLDDLREFPEAARKQAGYDLQKLAIEQWCVKG